MTARAFRTAFYTHPEGRCLVRKVPPGLAGAIGDSPRARRRERLLTRSVPRSHEHLQSGGALESASARARIESIVLPRRRRAETGDASTSPISFWRRPRSPDRRATIESAARLSRAPELLSRSEPETSRPLRAPILRRVYWVAANGWARTITDQDARIHGGRGPEAEPSRAAHGPCRGRRGPLVAFLSSTGSTRRRTGRPGGIKSRIGAGANGRANALIGPRREIRRVDRGERREPALEDGADILDVVRTAHRLFAASRGGRGPGPNGGHQRVSKASRFMNKAPKRVMSREIHIDLIFRVSSLSVSRARGPRRRLGGARSASAAADGLAGSARQARSQQGRRRPRGH